MPVFFCLDSLDTGGTHPVRMLGRGRRERKRMKEARRKGEIKEKKRSERG